MKFKRIKLKSHGKFFYAINQILQYAVYVLISPVNKKPFYVGLTQNVNSRFSNHCNELTKSTSSYIKKLKRKNLIPQIKIIYWSNDEEKARWVENKITS